MPRLSSADVFFSNTGMLCCTIWKRRSASSARPRYTARVFKATARAPATSLSEVRWFCHPVHSPSLSQHRSSYRKVFPNLRSSSKRSTFSSHQRSRAAVEWSHSNLRTKTTGVVESRSAAYPGSCVPSGPSSPRSCPHPFDQRFSISNPPDLWCTRPSLVQSRRCLRSPSFSTSRGPASVPRPIGAPRDLRELYALL